MSNTSKKELVKVVLLTVSAVVTLVLIIMVLTCLDSCGLPGEDEFINIPGEMLYKDIVIGGFGWDRFKIYSFVDGRVEEIDVGEEQFKSLDIPHKLANGLFRLPDGRIVTELGGE